MSRCHTGKTIQYTLAAIFISGLIATPLFAGSMTFVVGGETDTLHIALNPSSGVVHGQPGSTVGWGFTVTWTGTNNWLSFTGTSLGSATSPETNCSIMASYTGPGCPAGGYTDMLGLQGGPTDFGMAPGTTWTQAFDGVSNGVGAYAISADPSLLLTGASDTGQITFNFDIYSGNPNVDGVTAYPGYSYYGSTTAFSVTVDAPGQSAPEPDTFALLGAGLALAGLFSCRRAPVTGALS